MVAGDVTCTHYGMYDISSAALFSLLDGLNISSADLLHIIPSGPNLSQVAVIKLARA